MATLWPLSFQVQVDLNGVLAARAKAFFYDPGTTTARTVYTDSALSVPHSHPVVADGVGRFPAVYLPFGDFRVRATDENGAVLFEADGVSNTDPATGGGGGGGGSTDGFVTGDMMWQPLAGVRASWARANGKSIGSATSGATERANSDTLALFTHIWNNIASATVSGGRGASASADFLANKTISLPDMRGRIGIGLDDMGNTAANRLQVQTTIDTTINSTTATVLSATGLAIGMTIIATDGVAAGTTITGITGTTLTLSANATATLSGTSARFSFFGDAQTAGQSAGIAGVVLREDELAAHAHGGATASAGDHTHTYDKPSLNLTGAAGGFINGVAVTAAQATSSAGAHTHTIATSGKGLPHNNLPPVVTGTWFIHL